MKHVLFVCNHNAGRSQMAQAFFERVAPDEVRAESAGSSPARTIWPEVVETPAHRRGRECLRAEVCDVLAVTP